MPELESSIIGSANNSKRKNGSAQSLTSSLTTQKQHNQHNSNILSSPFNFTSNQPKNENTITSKAQASANMAAAAFSAISQKASSVISSSTSATSENVTEDTGGVLNKNAYFSSFSSNNSNISSNKSQKNINNNFQPRSLFSTSSFKKQIIPNTNDESNNSKSVKDGTSSKNLQQKSINVNKTDSKSTSNTSIFSSSSFLDLFR